MAGLTGLQALLPAFNIAPEPPSTSTSTIAADFLGTGPIEVSRVTADQAYAIAMVRNDSPQAAEAEIRLIALDRHGQELSGKVGAKLDPFTPTAVRVRLDASRLDLRRDDRLPARGYAILRAWPAGSSRAGSPTVKVREIVVPQVQPSFAEGQLTMAGVVAGLLVLLFGLAIAPTAKINVNTAITGTPKWTPQSWSTNLAIGGALLTGLLAIAGLPAQGHYATKLSYTALAAFFATLVALAPAVYGLLRVGQVSPRTALCLFSFAAAVTVWATVGQLGTAALVILELGMARVLPGTTATAAAVLFGGSAVLVVAYAFRAVYAYSQPDGSPVAVKSGAGGAVKGPVPPPSASTEWPLL